MPNETRTNWDLSVLYQSDTDPQIELEKATIAKLIADFAKKWRDNPDYSVKPDVLKAALDEYEQLKFRYGADGAAGFYFWLRSELDQLDPTLKAKFQQIIEFGEKNANQIRFFTLEIAKIPAEQQPKFLQAPELETYRHFLERLFTLAKYQLSEKEENILSLLSLSAYNNWVRMTEEFLSAEEREVEVGGKKELLPFPGLISLTTSRDKAVRDQAGMYVDEITDKHASVAEQEMNAILQTKKIEDELRSIERPDLDRHLGDDIDPTIVEAMLSVVEKNFELSQRFYELKAKLLGVKKLGYYERGVDYGDIPDDYDAAKAIELVDKTLFRLDPEFVEIFQMMLKKGQIDFFPKKGKSGGAFCAMGLPALPTFVMLNHTNKLRDVTTLAHEMGHAINDELIKKHQHALNCGTSLAVAEVASTFIEDFVLEEIGKAADDERRLAILMLKLNDEVSTIFRQVAAYRFEQALHEAFRAKGYLPKSDIGNLFKKHMSGYLGSAIDMNPGSENWWVFWSHFRRFFYVYSYASGLLISKALQRQVRQDPKFITKVKGFLSAGSSASPKDIFAKLGIDITDPKFWQTGLEETNDLLDEAEKLARNLGKI